MAKYTLQSNLENRKNSKVVLPHSGVTVFNEQGIAEVELENESHLAHLLNSIEDLSVYDPNKKEDEDKLEEQTEDQDLGKSVDEENDLGGGSENFDITGENQNTDAGSTGDLASQLEALKLSELKQLASDSGFPEEEWKAFKKEELKAYLSSKLLPQA